MIDDNVCIRLTVGNVEELKVSEVDTDIFINYETLYDIKYTSVDVNAVRFGLFSNVISNESTKRGVLVELLRKEDALEADTIITNNGDTTPVLEVDETAENIEM